MRKISVLVSAIGQGGAEKVMAGLASLIAAKSDFNAELVVVTPLSGDVRQSLPEKLKLVELNAKHYMVALKPLYEAVLSKKLFRAFFLSFQTLFVLWRDTLFPIVRYIRYSRPDVILTAHYNSVTILANWLAGSPSKIVITEHTVLSSYLPSQIWFIRNFFPVICRFFYPRANRVVGVSKFVADDIISYLGVPKDIVTHIYNPITGGRLENAASEKCQHQWFGGNAPVFVAVGRMSEEKDYKTLLNAFAMFRDTAEAYLLMLGDGVLMRSLREYADELGVGEYVGWLGYVHNPIPYIESADLFLMSSRYEGLPTVVIEALFVGTTIVSTDCPGGVREILDNGGYGYLVPVNSPRDMADTMKRALENPFPKEKLRSRVEIFSETAALKSYLCLLGEILSGKIK